MKKWIYATPSTKKLCFRLVQIDFRCTLLTSVSNHPIRVLSKRYIFWYHTKSVEDIFTRDLCKEIAKGKWTNRGGNTLRRLLDVRRALDPCADEPHQSVERTRGFTERLESRQETGERLLLPLVETSRRASLSTEHDDASLPVSQGETGTFTPDRLPSR